MKHCYTLLLLMWCSLAGAQTDFRFADSTAQWSVLSAQWCMNTPCASFSTGVYSAPNDTIINQLWYQQIYGFNSPVCYLRKDSVEKVYGRYKSDSVEFLLYDFGWQVGDSITLGNALGRTWPYSVVDCRLDSIDTVDMGGLRRRFYVSYRIPQWNSGWSFERDIWIEGIGSLGTHFLSPGLDPQSLDGQKEDLLCFFEKDSLLYHDFMSSYFTDDTLSCFLNFDWVGVNDIGDAGGNLNVLYYRPYCIVKYSKPIENSTQLSLYDLTGRLILQKELTEQTTRIDLGDMAQGVYVYSIQYDKRKVKAGKLVIE